MAYKATSPLPNPGSEDAFVKIVPFETAWMQIPASLAIEGLTGSLRVTSWRFYVTHATSGTKLWFDLGVAHVRSHNGSSYQMSIFSPDIKPRRISESSAGSVDVPSADPASAA
jgi:hypothetical protein